MTGPAGAVVCAVAAGPRLGFGHLVRSRSLARALDVPWRVCLRGSADTARAALSLGADLVHAPFGDATAPVGLLIVDDPSPREAARWVAGARRRGIPVASIHDGGIGTVASDLIIDGSVCQPAARPASNALRGPAYAILDPAVAATARVASGPARLFLTLGGGAHVQGCASRLCRALDAARPGIVIRVARGFAGGQACIPLSHGEWVDLPDGVAPELARATVAIVSGGVTLAEACAMGVPAVGVAVTRAQQTAIRALAHRGAVVDGGLLEPDDTRMHQVAAAALALVDSPAEQGRLSSVAARLIDGHGAARVAAALRRLLAVTTDTVEAHDAA